jgi:hypothetical protein
LFASKKESGALKTSGGNSSLPNGEKISQIIIEREVRSVSEECEREE